jgi:hypothetical protein
VRAFPRRLLELPCVRSTAEKVLHRGAPRLKLSRDGPNESLMRTFSTLAAPLVVGITCGLAFGAPPPARAAAPTSAPADAPPEAAYDGPLLTVDPPRVEFDAAHRSHRVKVTNHGKRAVVVDVMPRVWAVGATGGRVLEESEEIFPYPSVLHVPPGATVKLSLVHTPPSGAPDMEHRFEVALEGNERAEGGGWGADARARIDVGVSPREPRVEPTFDPPKVAHGLLDMRLNNAGNVSFGAKWITLIAHPLEGEPVEASVSGWYVIPGGHHDLLVALPDGVMCIDHLQVRVDTVAGTRHKIDFPIDPAACDTSPLPGSGAGDAITLARRRTAAAPTR